MSPIYTQIIHLNITGAISGADMRSNIGSKDKHEFFSKYLWLYKIWYGYTLFLRMSKRISKHTGRLG